MPTGLAYYYFAPESYDYLPDQSFAKVPGIVNSLSGNPNYEYSGTIQNLNTINIDGTADTSSEFTLPNSANTVPGSDFAMIFQGYLFASAGAGTYTISSQIDDISLAWLGPNKAYGTEWNYDNRDFLNECCTGIPSTTSVTLAAGEAYPMTLFFGNANGPGSTDFNIITPDGVKHTDTSAFVIGGCDGQALFEP